MLNLLKALIIVTDVKGFSQQKEPSFGVQCWFPQSSIFRKSVLIATASKRRMSTGGSEHKCSDRSHKTSLKAFCVYTGGYRFCVTTICQSPVILQPRLFGNLTGLPPDTILTDTVLQSNRAIPVYNVCLISISNSVSGGAKNNSVLNIEGSWYDYSLPLNMRLMHQTPFLQHGFKSLKF